MFHYLLYCAPIPRTKLFGYNISVCVGELRHVTEILKGLEPAYFCDLFQSSAPFFQR